MLITTFSSCSSLNKSNQEFLKCLDLSTAKNTNFSKTIYIYFTMFVSPCYLAASATPDWTLWTFFNLQKKDIWYNLFINDTDYYWQWFDNSLVKFCVNSLLGQPNEKFKKVSCLCTHVRIIEVTLCRVWNLVSSNKRRELKPVSHPEGQRMAKDKPRAQAH